MKSLQDDDWAWVPAGGVRSAAAIVGHLASCKVMYENHAFGDGSLTWDDPRFGTAQSPGHEGAFSPVELVEWLRDSQLQLVRSIDALGDDSELDAERGVNWGGTRPTRWIIHVLIHHDSFHAGEINHLRAIHQRNDGWEWES